MNKRLASYQHKIVDIMDRAEALLRGATRPSAMAMGTTRWALARALTEYQVYMHSRIFDPIIAAERGPRAELARRLRDDCMALGAAYRAYVSTWSVAGILDNWDAYQPAALAIIAQIRRHLDQERRNVATLFEQPADVEARSAA
jgi:hypothetical protein